MMPRLHVAEQGGFLPSSLCPPTIRPDVLVVHGTGIEGNEGDTHAQFIAYTQVQIQTTLTTYLTSRSIPLTSSDIFILDMEQPNNGTTTFAHPSSLGDASPAVQAEIITAWKTRIAAARAVLPNAQLGMYGTLVPNSRGLESAGYITQKNALIAAGTSGLYDGLDWLVPVVYPRFGPNDTAGQFGSYVAMTAQAARDSKLLLRSTGVPIPLLPLMQYRVFNGSSNDNNKLVLDFGLPAGMLYTLMGQWSSLRAADIRDIALWIPATEANDLALPAPNSGGWTLGDFLMRLMPTTSVTLIRDQMVSTLEGATPTSQTGVKFRAHRDETEFFDWCGQNKAASLRRIEVRGGESFQGPEVTNTDVEFHRVPMTVTVAYPMEWGKYGVKNRASLEKMVEEDMHLIDDSIGTRGQANWTGGSWAMKVRDETAEQDGVLFSRLHFDVGYFRSV